MRLNFSKHLPWVLVSFVVSSYALGGSKPSGGLGGVVVPPAEADDLTPEERAEIEAKILEYYKVHPSLPTGGAPQSYPFFPQAGTLWQDLFVSNFVDLGGVRDFDCTDWTYAGHTGHDSLVRSFQESAIGVPVFAALDGTVIDAQDWEQDLNTVWRGLPANYVILDHGGTHNTWYVHLKRGSVAVSVGQFVPAGTQLGLTASSGNSNWPHLHFESRFNGQVYEPSAGACRPGPSNWVNQIPVRRDLYVRELAFSDGPFDGALAIPWDQARHTGTYVVGNRWTFFRVEFNNLPASSAWRFRYLRPDGTTAVDFNGNFDNPFYREVAPWWYYNLNLNQTGTWRLVFDLNGATVADAPFTIVSDRSQVINRPPNAVSIAFDPAAPTANDVIFCRVQTSLFLRDPDYDIVSYRYQWTVNGNVVRASLNAALSDAIPKGSASVGDLVTCSVTPFDGQLDGPVASSSVVITSP